MGLCWSGALRGLCGFCARVELGGLKACGVFASVFIFLSSLLGLCLCCPRLVLLFAFALFVSLSVFVSCCGYVVGFSFSLSDYTQKRGRKGFPLRPLFVCRECSNSCNVIEELRGRCFGSF